MLRTFAYSFACLAVAMGIAQAIPARLPYEPPDPPKPPQAFIELRDTAWAGIEPADRNIFFHSNGGLSYGIAQKPFGTWKQEGNTVYFEFNKRYREFRGTIEGNTIRGESWNTAGKRWQTRLHRPSVPPLGPLP
ncbi:MAG: hypothetical protein EXR98_02530 [Gemmataceae bacterium]|nr:hypothetical protein [Gemmataceae bacterium]